MGGGRAGGPALLYTLLATMHAGGLSDETMSMYRGLNGVPALLYTLLATMHAGGVSATQRCPCIVG